MPVVSAGGVLPVFSARRVLPVIAAGRVLPIITAGPARAEAAAGVHHGSVGETQRGNYQECLRQETDGTALLYSPIHGFASSAFANAICLASLGSCGWKRLDAMSFGNFQPDKIAMYSGEPGSLRWLITILRGSGFPV